MIARNFCFLSDLDILYFYVHYITFSFVCFITNYFSKAYKSSNIHHKILSSLFYSFTTIVQGSSRPNPMNFSKIDQIFVHFRLFLYFLNSLFSPFWKIFLFLIKASRIRDNGRRNINCWKLWTKRNLKFTNE